MTGARARTAAFVFSYALMCAAGLAAIAWPSPAVRAATTATAGILVYVWASLLALGGASCALGAATDRWLGEYAGLWPLITTFLVYGLASFTSSRGPVAYGGGFLLLSIAAFMFARWQDVALIRREATRSAGER